MFIENVTMCADNFQTSYIAIASLATGMALGLVADRLVYDDPLPEFHADLAAMSADAPEASTVLFQSEGYAEGTPGSFSVERDPLGRLMVEEITGDESIPAVLTYIS